MSNFITIIGTLLVGLLLGTTVATSKKIKGIFIQEEPETPPPASGKPAFDRSKLVEQPLELSGVFVSEIGDFENVHGGKVGFMYNK